jgi:hypothetical protein
MAGSYPKAIGGDGASCPYSAGLARRRRRGTPFMTWRPTLARAASRRSVSIARGVPGIAAGRPMRKPWPSSTPRAYSIARSARRSIPSASSRAPIRPPNETNASTSAWRAVSRAIPWTISRSILITVGRSAAIIAKLA